jgi:predicted Fe-Mo cluster-binding NifX family protein
MKIAVTSTGDSLNSPIDARFGRCGYFVIVDPENETVDAIANEPGPSGAGSGGAATVARAGVEVVITGQLGPNAARALQELGIRSYRIAGGTVQEAVEAYARGELEELDRANVPSHAGLGMGPGAAASGMGPGRNRGAGAGRGRGGGRGRGAGGGGGRGGGR